ncbi:MAG TPA: carboxylating nicotinate-nucleotide diphosphorylase, partial [Longimicrobiales bacterium]|nr:carboxylating nicotinate-nucleotide diphosphorylase [Longimicrobiales bacterium]
FPLDDSVLRLIDLALAEDRGAGDWATRWIIPARTRATATVTANSEGVVAGLGVASAVFLRLDPRVEVMSACSDGDVAHAGDVICTVHGPARAILTGERTALNFLQRLGGIATATRAFVEAVAGTPARIVDTRLTTPAWRAVERAAVIAGGAESPRAGLYDAAIITPEHITIAGGAKEAITRVRDANSKNMPVIVAVADKDSLKAALEVGCERILLQDMDVQALREAVRIIRKTSPEIEIEASGNMALDRVRAVAEAGVDFISVSALTHGVAPLDLSLKITA